MKMLRCVLAVACFCVLTSVAKADSSDFQMVVLDPSFATYPIFSTPYSPIVFSDCSGQLPTNVTQSYDGCFTGVNRTGQDWVGLQLFFDNTEALGSQPVGCTPDGGGADLFTISNCSLSGGQYVLSYTGGTIFNNEFFVIAESGVSPDSFPPGTLVATTSVPEPGSMWLFTTGMSMTGLLYANRRQWLASGARR